jgi:Na+/H+-dicarboxylate symporter
MRHLNPFYQMTSLLACTLLIAGASAAVASAVGNAASRVILPGNATAVNTTELDLPTSPNNRQEKCECRL